MSILIATASRNVNRGDGVAVKVRRGRTTAHATHPVVAAHPDLWAPMPVDFPAPAGGAPVVAAPSAKDVRAWAKTQGIDVPARGKIPDEVIAAYQAAAEE